MSLNLPNLPALTNKGDLAVFGLAYGIGFALDVALFEKNTPPPSTVALVFAIACLAIKSGYEAVREESPPEPLPISDQERHERLRDQFATLGKLFDSGVNYTDHQGRKLLASLPGQVLRETRWEPNLNYNPQNEYYAGEPQYHQIGDYENIRERYLALRTLWESRLVTDEYVEARLADLTDFIYRKVAPQVIYIEEPESGQPSSFS